MTRWLATLAALLGIVSPVASGPVSAATTTQQEPAHCAHPFTRSFQDRVARAFPHQRVTASIEDLRTGCWYHLRPRMHITTASVIKAQVMGAVLLQAQDQHRGLTPYETERIHPMIRYSYNCPDVCDLYQHVGGVAGMNRFDQRFGIHHTANTAEYGGTWTTSNDRTIVSRKMLYGGGPLHAAYRKIAWHSMTHVHPTQRWGITAGVPSGWTVALKNGFYPESGYGWRVGSTGVVRNNRTGSGYAMTVMTDHDANQFQGIRLVERVARHVTALLTTGQPAARPVDRAVCVQTHDGESWQAVARQVGQPAGRYAGVRQVSGDNPDPLSGQRACSPVLRPHA